MAKSDEQNLHGEPECDLWGQIWLIVYLWPLVAILDFGKYNIFFRSLFVGSGYKSMQFIFQIRWIGSICQAEMWSVGYNLVNFDLWPPAAILDYLIKEIKVGGWSPILIEMVAILNFEVVAVSVIVECKWYNFIAFLTLKNMGTYKKMESCIMEYWTCNTFQVMRDFVIGHN